MNMDNATTVFLIIGAFALIGLAAVWLFDRPSHRERHP